MKLVQDPNFNPRKEFDQSWIDAEVKKHLDARIQMGKTVDASVEARAVELYTKMALSNIEWYETPLFHRFCETMVELIEENMESLEEEYHIDWLDQLDAVLETALTEDLHKGMLMGFTIGENDLTFPLQIDNGFWDDFSLEEDEE